MVQVLIMLSLLLLAAAKNLTPGQRSTRSRLASHRSWALTQDRTKRTLPGRQGLLRRFEDQVDPQRTLTPAERAKRVESARKAHYTAMAFKASQARRRRSGASQSPPPDEGASHP